MLETPSFSQKAVVPRETHDSNFDRFAPSIRAENNNYFPPGWRVQNDQNYNHEFRGEQQPFVKRKLSQALQLAEQWDRIPSFIKIYHNIQF